MMIKPAAKRVLVVEDEALIGAMVAEWLDELGCQAIGPATRLAQGFALAEQERIDGAILDVNVNSEPVYPLAAYLRGRHIPMIFATGYGETMENSAHHAQILEKPFTFDQLGQALATAGILPNSA